MLRRWLVLVVVLFAPLEMTLAMAADARSAKPETFKEFSAQKQRLDGYFPLLIDAAEGRIYLEVPKDRGQFILQGSLARGVGSNDVGLDRGQLSDNTRLVVFERVGKRALL